MSDNEDLLGDDLGDHSLADYNLGNEEEEQLLADDYDSGSSQNVSSSFNSSIDTVPTGPIEYAQPVSYTQPETECVVPNIIVEVPNLTQPEPTPYKQYNESYEQEQAVPPAIPAAPVESPQIVPSDVPVAKTNAQRSPMARNIPDSLDKVFVPRNSYNGRGRSSWRNPNYRQSHPYRRNNTFRGNFVQRPSFQPTQIRPQLPNQPIRPEIPEIRPEIPHMGPEIPERLPPQEIIPPDHRFNQNFQRFPYRSDERSTYAPNIRPNFERPMFYQGQYNPRQFPPRDMPNNMGNNMPHVIRQPLPGLPVNLPKVREPEVRMLPVLPPNLPNIPPGGLAGKKVLINPHFKGTFQPPVEGFPTYIPTRIQKSPPLSPTLESKFGPIKDIDDAAERFIAEQRNALARAANRKLPRRSPQRYIENTTIEIENDLVRSCEERELLRRQEEFINANRAGLRRRMRSPSPARSPSPRRSPERRARPLDEESEYRRRVREQETLRERVLRAKELRRRKNAALLRHDREKDKDRPESDVKPEIKQEKPEIKDDKPETTDVQQVKPDTTRTTPERIAKTEKQENTDKQERDRSPIKIECAEANSTCETLTPPPASPERALTPPLPPALPSALPPALPSALAPAPPSDDDLDLILDDIDDILSDDDDSGRFKDKTTKEEPPKTTKQVDLRSKLPPKTLEAKKPRQKIIFNDSYDDKNIKEKSPARRPLLGSNKNINIEKVDIKIDKAKPKIQIINSSVKSRQKITFDSNNKEVTDTKIETNKEKPPTAAEKRTPFPNRRVIIRKIDKPGFPRADPSQPTPSIFTRAVRTTLGGAEPPSETPTALVSNLPPGMTDTRLRTLATDSQNLTLDREERTAVITFKTLNAAETFKKKFNNKMVAASRLSVTLQ